MAGTSANMDFTKAYDLFVHYAPTIIKSMENLNDKIQMKCTTDAYPQAVINWYKEGTLLKNDASYLIEGNIKSSSLSVDSQLYGDYKCHAQNFLNITIEQFSIKGEIIL